jgi:hypothetical protein
MKTKLASTVSNMASASEMTHLIKAFLITRVKEKQSYNKKYLQNESTQKSLQNFQKVFKTEYTHGMTKKSRHWHSGKHLPPQSCVFRLYS